MFVCLFILLLPLSSSNVSLWSLVTAAKGEVGAWVLSYKVKLKDHSVDMRYLAQHSGKVCLPCQSVSKAHPLLESFFFFLNRIGSRSDSCKMLLELSYSEVCDSLRCVLYADVLLPLL